MRYFVIFLAFIFVVAIATNQTSYAQCAYDPNLPHKSCDDVHVTLVIETHEARIENIDGQLFHVIGPFALEQESDDRISLDGVTFTYPSYPNPPIPGGPVSVMITFESGAIERIYKVGSPLPFVEFVGVEPQAGVRRNTDGSFDFLLSVRQQLVSPLKQFKSGITVDEISCGESLILMTKHDGSPACVSQFTAPKLADRGWVWVLDLGFWKDSPMLIPPTEYVIKTDNGTFAGQYMMSSASVGSISYDESANSLVILMNSNERGILHMEMPNVLSYPINDAPFSYAVSVNGEAIEHGELSPMILEIPFEKGTERIEIIGTYIP